MDGATNTQTGVTQTGQLLVAPSGFHPKRWLQREAAKAGETYLERDREWVCANNCSEDPCGLDPWHAFTRWSWTVGFAVASDECELRGAAKRAWPEFEYAYVNG
jgi:hypothetical protein